MSKDNFHEKRRDTRVSNSVPVRMSLAEGDLITETGNISRSGACCRVTRYIEPMTKLKINLLLPIKKNGKSTNKKIVCEGVIVRTEEVITDAEYNVAIFFSDIRESDAENIADYISSYLEQQATKA